MARENSAWVQAPPGTDLRLTLVGVALCSPEETHGLFIFDILRTIFREIAIRFLLAFAKPFFFRGIFSAPYSFMRISHLHGL